MPIYEYECQSCGQVCDVLQKLGDAALTDCPGCGASRLRKRVSAPAFHVKGAVAATTTRTRVGHTLDGPHTHSHDDDHGHTHSHACGDGKCHRH